jgi:hypothetical protein
MTDLANILALQKMVEITRPDAVGMHVQDQPYLHVAFRLSTDVSDHIKTQLISGYFLGFVHELFCCLSATAGPDESG